MKTIALVMLVSAMKQSEVKDHIDIDDDFQQLLAQIDKSYDKAEKINQLDLDDKKSLDGTKTYNSKDIQKVLDNLEFLNHRPSDSGAKALITDPVHKDKRLEKLHSLVGLVNQNV